MGSVILLSGSRKLYYINRMKSLPKSSLFSFLRIFIFLFALLVPSIVISQTLESEKSAPKNAKPQLIAKLPPAINETSGLVFFNGTLWTINDSGNPAEIYQLDTVTGAILRTVTVRNAVNTDWEAITHDDSNMYIGDFGNNFGNRTDLKILKIPKADFLNTANDTVEAGYIHFSYQDQTSRERELNNNNFDCEAFFYYNDSLYLFTKNWLDLETKCYILPSDTGTYTIAPAGRFSAGGLITDASVNAKGNIILLGYKNIKGQKWECFCWLFRMSGAGICFDGNKKQIGLGSAWHLGQTEGIFLNADNTVWLSSESILAGKLFRPAKLFSVSFKSSYLSFQNKDTGYDKAGPANSRSGE